MAKTIPTSFMDGPLCLFIPDILWLKPWLFKISSLDGLHFIQMSVWDFDGFVFIDLPDISQSLLKLEYYLTSRCSKQGPKAQIPQKDGVEQKLELKI